MLTSVRSPGKITGKVWKVERTDAAPWAVLSKLRCCTNESPDKSPDHPLISASSFGKGYPIDLLHRHWQPLHRAHGGVRGFSSFPFSQADFNDLTTCTMDVNIAAPGFCLVSMLERALNVCSGALRATWCGLWSARAVMNVRGNVGFLPRELIYQGKAASVKPVFLRRDTKWMNQWGCDAKVELCSLHHPCVGSTEVKQLSQGWTGLQGPRCNRHFFAQ